MKQHLFNLYPVTNQDDLRISYRYVEVDGELGLGSDGSRFGGQEPQPAGEAGGLWTEAARGDHPWRGKAIAGRGRRSSYCPM